MVRIERLDPSFAGVVDELWDYKYDGSREMIRDQLNLGLGLAAYVEGREKPVAWTLVARKLHFGFIYFIRHPSVLVSLIIQIWGAWNPQSGSRV